MNAETIGFGVQALARLLWYVAVFQLIGTLGARMVTAPSSGAGVASPFDRTLARSALAAATALVAITMVRLLLQTYAIFGIDEGVTLEGLRIVALDTQWGIGWRWQAAAAAAALALSAFGGRGYGSFLQGIAAVAVSVTLPLTGHAVAEPWPVFSVAVQVAHVLAGGLWLGTLFLLFVLIAVKRTGEAPLVGAWVNAFSPLALTSAAVLMISGLVTTIRYVDFPAGLWTTGYGGVLSAKIAVVAAVLASGAVNWRRVRPRLNAGAGIADFRRWALTELGFAFMVLAITSALVGLPKE